MTRAAPRTARAFHYYAVDNAEAQGRETPFAAFPVTHRVAVVAANALDGCAFDHGAWISLISAQGRIRGALVARAGSLVGAFTGRAQGISASLAGKAERRCEL